MKVFVVVCISMICVLTGSINNRSNLVWSAQGSSVSARILANASVSNPAGTLQMDGILDDKRPPLRYGGVMLRLPQVSAADIVLKTESKTIRYSLSPYQTYASDVQLIGSALLLPIEARNQQLLRSCQVCTLSVIFPHD